MIIVNNTNTDEESIKKTSIMKYVPYFFLAVVLIVMNGLNNAYLNTLFSVLMVCMALFFPSHFGILLYPIINIFLGYSVIQLQMIGGISLDKATLSNLIWLIILLKCLYESRYKLKLEVFESLYIILALYTGVLVFVHQGTMPFVSHLSELLSIYFLRKYLSEKDDDYCLFFAIVFLIALIGEFVYGVINGVQYVTYGWRLSQFTGVFDPNNCAMHFNVFLIYILIVKPNIFSKTKKIILSICCSLVILATISMSGIFMLFGIYIVLGICSGTKIQRYLLYSIGVILIIVFMLIGPEFLLEKLSNSDIPIVGNSALRIQRTLLEFNQGNYNSFSTGRFDLSSQYMQAYAGYSLPNKLFGNISYANNLREISIGRSSHNFYIDYLISYGFIGLSLFLLMVFGIVQNHIRQRKYDRILIGIVVLVVCFTRSLDSSFIYLVLGF